MYANNVHFFFLSFSPSYSEREERTEKHQTESGTEKEDDEGMNNSSFNHSIIMNLGSFMLFV